MNVSVASHERSNQVSISQGRGRGQHPFALSMRPPNISHEKDSTVPSVSVEASSLAGINSTLSVLQATMLSFNKTQVLSALTS